MNTPLILFEKKLPIEIIFYIQRYVSNDFAFEAIKKHIKYSYDQEILYRQFVYNEYIIPNCPNWCSGFSRRRCYHQCDECHDFQFTDYYSLQKYTTCIKDNTQIKKFNVTPTYGKANPSVNLNCYGFPMS